MNPIVYDFRKPARLPPEWHKLLHGWFHTAAALASRGWGKNLSVPLENAGVLMEDFYAQAALAALPGDSIGQHITLGPGRVPTLLVLRRSVLLNLVGVMLGEEQAQEDRELTVVEEQLAEYFLLNHWIPYYRECWPGPVPLSWQLGPREIEPQYSRLFAPGEVLLQLDWQVRGPFGDGRGQWLFPRQALVQALQTEAELAAQSVDEKEITARKVQIVRSLPLAVECILGTAQFSLSELSQLQVGDVLLLDQKSGDRVTALVGGRQMYRAQVGKNGSWKAFRIESFIEK